MHLLVFKTFNRISNFLMQVEGNKECSKSSALVVLYGHYRLVLIMGALESCH